LVHLKKGRLKGLTLPEAAPDQGLAEMSAAATLPDPA
jgi:hypothetical protein